MVGYVEGGGEVEKIKSNISSVEQVGDIVTEIITFSSGNKKTFEGVIAKTITQGEFTNFYLTDGRRIFINTKNVDFFEVLKK
jgi:hypothetical protein